MAAESVDPVDCSAQPLDFSFHPEREHLVAAALVDGTLEVHDFLPTQSGEDDSAEEEDTIVSSTPIHTKAQQQQRRKPSCRAVRFSSNYIYTGGSGGDLCGLDAEVACTLGGGDDANKKALLWRIPDAHSHGIHVLHQLPSQAPCGGPLLVTGDDEGAVRLWDERICGGTSTATSQAKSKGLPRGCVMSWEENTDYISGFDTSVDGTTLLASSSDCTLSIFDLRKAKEFRRSDDQEDELLSVAVMKNGKKVVCGTQEGVLAVWSWGTWGDISDRFPGHPASIDALLKVDEDTMLTGSSDGLVRVVQIHPDKMLGVLGDHDGFPVESLQFNASRQYIGSLSHDNLIRLWDANILDNNQEGSSEDDVDEKIENVRLATKPQVGDGATVARAGPGHASDDEWEDIDDDEDMDALDSSDDSDDEEQGRGEGKRGRTFKSENERFFEDL